MKNMKKFTFSFLFTTFLLVGVNLIKAEAAIDNKPGDIIVTNSTSSSGISGHTGIYIDTTHILHTSGWSSEPYPTVLTETQWHGRYAQSKVIRPNSATLGQGAANAAKTYFQNKQISYRITSNPKDLTYTYCSELVWYSYYKAGKEYKVYFPQTPTTPGYWGNPGIIEPYSYINTGAVSYNGFTFIDNTW